MFLTYLNLKFILIMRIKKRYISAVFGGFVVFIKDCRNSYYYQYLKAKINKIV